MNITMTTSAKTDEQGRELLKGWEFRFAKREPHNKWHAQQKSPSRSRSRNSKCGSATAAASVAARAGISASSRCAASVSAVWALKGEIPGVVKASW